MPFTRISLNAGRTPEELAAISKSLHTALVDAFEVPAADLFQIFHQHQPGELVFDANYLGGPRSDGFILFHITTARNRSDDVKQRFYRRLVDNLAASPGIRPEDVMVVIANSTFADWSLASGVAAPVALAEAAK